MNAKNLEDPSSVKLFSGKCSDVSIRLLHMHENSEK